MWWIFLIPIIVLFLTAIAKAFITTPSQELNKKFVGLGVLKGKTYNQIASVTGEANSKTVLGNKILCQWITPGYHISILFDMKMICIGVQNEIKIDENDI